MVECVRCKYRATGRSIDHNMFSGSTKVECNVFAFFARSTYAWVNEKGDIHVVHVLTWIERASVDVANQSVTRV